VFVDRQVGSGGQPGRERYFDETRQAPQIILGRTFSGDFDLRSDANCDASGAGGGHQGSLVGEVATSKSPPLAQFHRNKVYYRN
jgi:hypothetical protein